MGLRQGTIAFDLPTQQVSREHLLRLYAQHEDELDGAPGPTVPAAVPSPVVMNCR